VVLDDFRWRFSYDVLYGNVDNPTPIGEVTETASINLNGTQARLSMSLGYALGPPIMQSMQFICQDVDTGNSGACTDSNPSLHTASTFGTGVERFPGSPYAILPPNAVYVIKFDFRELAQTTGIEYPNPLLTSAQIQCGPSAARARVTPLQNRQTGRGNPV
jgi:hypothetical protein